MPAPAVVLLTHDDLRSYARRGVDILRISLFQVLSEAHCILPVMGSFHGLSFSGAHDHDWIPHCPEELWFLQDPVRREVQDKSHHFCSVRLQF